jgi:hypothetical protein
VRVAENVSVSQSLRSIDRAILHDNDDACAVDTASSILAHRIAQVCA